VGGGVELLAQYDEFAVAGEHLGKRQFRGGLGNVGEPENGDKKGDDHALPPTDEM
jgi:hypothetical protein